MRYLFWPRLRHWVVLGTAKRIRPGYRWWLSAAHFRLTTNTHPCAHTHLGACRQQGIKFRRHANSHLSTRDLFISLTHLQALFRLTSWSADTYCTHYAVCDIRGFRVFIFFFFFVLRETIRGAASCPSHVRLPACCPPSLSSPLVSRSTQASNGRYTDDGWRIDNVCSDNSGPVASSTSPLGGGGGAGGGTCAVPAVFLLAAFYTRQQAGWKTHLWRQSQQLLPLTLRVITT